jgi:hypothetical protein
MTDLAQHVSVTRTRAVFHPSTSRVVEIMCTGIYEFNLFIQASYSTEWGGGQTRRIGKPHSKDSWCMRKREVSNTH